MVSSRLKSIRAGCEPLLLSERCQYSDDMRCQSQNVISTCTLVNRIMQSDSGLFRESSGSKSLTASKTGDDRSPASMRVDIIQTNASLKLKPVCTGVTSHCVVCGR